MKQCLECNKNLTSKHAKKFCSSSCAAKFNLRNRKPRTEESKLKTSTTIKNMIASGKLPAPKPPSRKKLYVGPYTKITFRKCTHCSRDFWAQNATVCCSKECRYQRSAFNNVKKQHIKFFSKSENQIITLHSNWEVIIANWLDSIDIKWTRPSTPLKWHDGTKTRQYTPDFFIVDCNLYVDVKNPLKIKQDEKKIKILKSSYNLIVGDIDHCQREIMAALP